MFKELIKRRVFNVRFVSTENAKENLKATRILNKDEYHKNLGNIEENIDAKPPEWDKALPYESIPGPKPLPLIGNAFRFLPFIGEFYNLTIKELYESFQAKYGKVVKLSGVGRDPIIFLFDVEDMENLLRGAGAFPIRRSFDSFTHYRTVTRKDVFQGVPGLLSVQGAEWFKIRSVINPILMQPRTVQQYAGKIDTVANKLIKNIRFFSKHDTNSEMPENFQDELYKWALESIGAVTLNKHLGCLDLNDSKDSEPQKLIFEVNQMLLLVYKLEVFPPIWKYIETPSWRRFVKIVDFIVGTVSKYIDEVLTKPIPKDVPEHQLNILQKLANNDKRIAFATVMDMFIAGIDTTGKTLAAALYFLAKNPDKQKSLREEVYKNLPGKNSEVTSEILNSSPYLKAVVKETTRIAPVTIGNMRTTIKDSVIGGYQIPKGTEMVTMNIVTANSDYFKDHQKFIPERWLRTEEKSDYSHKNVNPFAYLPFGYGPRLCIGKRIANLELEIAISKIIRNFELSWHHDDMVFSGQFLYGVDRPLRLRVKEL